MSGAHDSKGREQGASSLSGPGMPIAGKVQGECIHMACAKPEEALMAWMAYWRTPPDIDCDRCGKPLRAEHTPDVEGAS